ncbi:MAG: DNA-binding domain-containing protein [Nitrosomonadales bacterium]
MSNLNDELGCFARAIIDGESPSPRINTGTSAYSAGVALEVYRNNYRGNLHDALAGAYPVIVQLVGDDFFRYMARNYIEQHPSASANLHHYGARLAVFLAGFEPIQSLPYLPDVASLEWACHVAYFAADAMPLPLASLAEIPPEHYPALIFNTDCPLIRSRYPVAAIWQAHQTDAACDFHIDLDKGGGIALVSRKGDVVQVSALSAADADWLERMQTGTALGAATDATMVSYPDFDLQAALLNLFALGAWTEFTIGHEH